MSSRERWVVYPLLFFAFCLAARDQFPYLRPEVTEIRHLSCQVIDAKLIDAETMVATDLRADSIVGRKKIEGDVLRLNAVDTGQLLCNRLLVQSTQGRRMAELAHTDDGAGRLAIYSLNERETIVLSTGKESGQIESRHEDGLRMLIRATKTGGAVYVVDTDDKIVAQFNVEPAGTSPDERPQDRSEAPSAAGNGDNRAESHTEEPDRPTAR
jgi:hypothetical protein